ncbi:MAG: sugar phosphate isomerase/epimerase [Clostridia bacterium]|nr:sugar phosphate isomerase/epimerase [Clostridia bacterium]
MVKFKLSAFSDEYSSSLDEQIEGLTINKVRMTELRGVDGTNVSDLTPAEAAEVYRKLELSGISVSAVGSPIGKIKITDPMDAHLDKLKNTCEVAEAVGTSRIRMFSFYIPDGNYDACKNEVIDRVGRMLDVADEYGVQLCHENEKGIWGDIPERCRELLDVFEGRLGCVFDPANFIQCGATPFEAGYKLLKPYITYMHIKDALPNGRIVPAGRGIGSIPEMLACINLEFTGDFILTLEPHLRVFKGLDQLESSQRSELGNAYATAQEAFAAAVTNLRYCIPRTAQM